jgi:hypothetical protein
MHRLNYTLGGRQDRPLIPLIVIISSPDLVRRRTKRIDRQDMVDNMICAGVKSISLRLLWIFRNLTPQTHYETRSR